MDSKLICLVTIHGIGFQQAPTDGIPGYADMLHERLSKYLDASLLGDDPQRQRTQRGENGPVYVQSSWPPESNRSEPGLARLGTWAPVQPRTVDAAGKSLTDGDQRIAHVALVYSHLEDQGPRLGALAEAGTKAAFSLGHYASITGAARMVFADVTTMIEHHAPAGGTETPSLRVRADALRRSRQAPASSPGTQGSAAIQQPGGGLLATLRQLEDDVATYVCRNDLRERVRSFVRDALLRLIFREDVAGIVVNSHSQGTVVAFDVLRELPPFAASKVQWLVTAGSPLRKYTDIFCWGNEIGNMHAMGPWNTDATGPWTNFWDPTDPVADPLAPPAAWRPGSRRPRSAKPETLYQWIDPDTGEPALAPVDDRKVDNVRNSVGGGLRAHNYWDNEPEVVQPLAQILRRVAAQVAAQVAAPATVAAQV